MGFDATTTTSSIFAIWQTSLPSTTIVLYGLSPDALDQMTALDTNLVTVHQMTISGLTGATPFYLKAISVDALGRITESPVIAKTTK